jgi:hypothetical protein
MAAQKLIQVGWPAFLAASVLEMLVFAFVDPGDLVWFGQPVAWSRQGVYSVSFFVFWAICAAACWMAVQLRREPADVNPAL